MRLERSLDNGILVIALRCTRLALPPLWRKLTPAPFDRVRVVQVNELEVFLPPGYGQAVDDRFGERCLALWLFEEVEQAALRAVVWWRFYLQQMAQQVVNFYVLERECCFCWLEPVPKRCKVCLTKRKCWELVNMISRISFSNERNYFYIQLIRGGFLLIICWMLKCLICLNFYRLRHSLNFIFVE